MVSGDSPSCKKSVNELEVELTVCFCQIVGFQRKTALFHLKLKLRPLLELGNSLAIYFILFFFVCASTDSFSLIIIS